MRQVGGDVYDAKTTLEFEVYPLTVECPYCQYQMEVKGARPGRFTPACPQCSRQFAIVVPDQPDAKIIVNSMTEAGPSVRTVAKSSKTPSADAKSPGNGPPAQTRPVSQQKTKVSARATLPQTPVPKKLGGYEIIREIGRGGMGAVYLARQVSLDRQVAVKVMNPEWADDPIFLSRFIREAFAAAHLVHHNVVQIYDIGEEDGTHYFSMEFVEGQSLGELVNRQDHLSPEEAAGYILQAARGLKFAHEKNMIHRDVKPDNLMLNTEGIVKVADLGLVKTPESVEAELLRENPGASRESHPPDGDAKQSISRRTGVNITSVNKAMGTPAFMPPEQVRDASSVDHRADIYSLGCTFYVLLTGRPVFEGATAEEVMTQQTTKPVTRPEVVVKDVPGSLSDILMKMIAKRPDDRYQDLEAVISDIEDFLGREQPGAMRPSEEHAEIFEQAIRDFNGAVIARLRTGMIFGFFVLCPFLMVMMFSFGHPVYGIAALSLGPLATLSYILITGIATKSFLLKKVRQYVFSSKLADWLKAFAVLALLTILLFVLNLLWLALGVLLGSVIIAAGFHALIDRKLDAQRCKPLEAARKLLRSMRLTGIEEDELRYFIRCHGGVGWEPIYEALFGYEAKMNARHQWGVDDDGRPGKKFGSWRDRIVGWIDAREGWRKQEQERKHLTQIERKAYVARGVPELKARKQAERAASDMICRAASLKTKRPGQVEVLIKPRSFSLVNFVLGARARLVVGLALVSLCVIWMHQNDLIPGEELKDISRQMVEDRQLTDSDDLTATLSETFDLTNRKTEPLAIPLVPDSATGWFNSYNPGMAGLILIFSGMFAGVKMTMFLLPAMVVMIFGHNWGIPALGGIPEHYMSMAAGGVLAILGLYFGRS